MLCLIYFRLLREVQCASLKLGIKSLNQRIEKCFGGFFKFLVDLQQGPCSHSCVHFFTLKWQIYKKDDKFARNNSRPATSLDEFFLNSPSCPAPFFLPSVALGAAMVMKTCVGPYIYIYFFLFFYFKVGIYCSFHIS